MSLLVRQLGIQSASRAYSVYESAVEHILNGPWIEKGSILWQAWRRRVRKTESRLRFIVTTSDVINVEAFCNFCGKDIFFNRRANHSCNSRFLILKYRIPNNGCS